MATDPNRPVIELRILSETYKAAQTRARGQGQALAAVARTILFQEAARTIDTGPDDSALPGRPPLREYRQDRTKLRFVVDRDSYHVARDKIKRSGRSVASAVEDGLRQYARTGLL